MDQQIEQIRLRVISLTEDMKFLDELYAKKLSHETRLWAIGEQKSNESFQSPEMQEALAQQEHVLLKNIENTDELLKKLRVKLLRSLGKA